MSVSDTAEQVNYATTVLTLIILFTRMLLWFWRGERLDVNFALVAISALFVIARIVCNILYLQYGNAADVIKHAGYFDEANLQDVTTGSILVLTARALITVILWLQICILLNFYTRLTYGFAWVIWVIRITWAVVAITFTGTILLTFLECRPISLYWQVIPDPGQCVLAYRQLISQTVGNIVLDILLIVIAYPIVGMKKRTVAQHITLYTLFALGTFCIIISIIRVVSVTDSGSSQVIRSLWASVQMFVSTFVANAPNIYGSIRVHRRKRMTANGTLAAGYDLHTARNNRVRTGIDDIWLKMDEPDHIRLMTNSQNSVIRPLPPATTLFDDQTAPAPYSHQPHMESGVLVREEPGDVTRPSSGAISAATIRSH